MGNFRYYPGQGENEGKRYPRQSAMQQLDKPGLKYWSADLACDYIFDEMMIAIGKARREWIKVADKAANIGTEVHRVVAEWLKTGKEPKDPSPEVLSGFTAFLEWLDQFDDYKTLEIEKTVYADRWAGTYDWLVKLWFPDHPGTGSTWLIDFKSSKKPRNNKPYEEWRTQTAGYRSQEPRAEHNAVLRLDKLTGLPDFYDLSETYEQDLAVFECLVDLWYLRHPNFSQEV